MGSGKRGLRGGERVAAWFMGAPVALVLAGALSHITDPVAALGIGAVVGYLSGVGLLVALKGK